MFHFAPKTEREIQEAALAPEAEYDFDVLMATDEISKNSGSPMIKIKLGLYSDSGTIRCHVIDYLLPKLEAKLRHCCDTLGLLREYESGSLSAEMFMGRSGKVKIGIQEDKTGTYPPKNIVRDYICRPAKPLNSMTASDIPFGGPQDDLDELFT